MGGEPDVGAVKVERDFLPERADAADRRGRNW